MIAKTHFLFLAILLSTSLDHIHASIPNSRSYVLNCGASNEGVDADGRKWEPDADYLASKTSSSMFMAQTKDPYLPSSVPYMTARIFQSESSYIFSISPMTRHWVRLHFYPSSYDSLNISDSYFDVTAAEFTLLRNFSASATAEALSQTYIMREFSLIPLKSGMLTLTFNPSRNGSGCFAFINGIEVVPMPNTFDPAPFIDFSSQNVDTSSCSVQTMIRLNVGGQHIPASNDSGLTRIWYDDGPFLNGASAGVPSEAPKGVKIRYSNMSVSIAPVDVYRTARTMGPDPRFNQNYNLTWVFQVDLNFTYVARLHFCELVFTMINERVFDIYINNKTAMRAADVIAWSGSRGVPVYKDYVAYIGENSVDKQLTVALHPSISMKPEFYDAILNGLEVFKLNDSAGNLAGSNPVPSPTIKRPEKESSSNYSSQTRISPAVVIGGVLGGFSCCLMVFCCIYTCQRKRNDSKTCTDFWLPLYNLHTSKRKSSIAGKGAGNNNIRKTQYRHFSLEAVKRGTKDFHESRVIGVGGFGKVYKCDVKNGKKVAVKRANPSSEQGVNEFRTEIEMLSQLRHMHLVSLIGCCEEEGEMILVYDYMANGTLRAHLYKGDKPPLSWKQRLEICIGAAKGLHYLHTGSQHIIIHRDVKTTNILLDKKMVAKVSDFGLSKTGPSLNQSHVSTAVKGSFGYLDPEYYKKQKLTEKSDVYSFGVVLYEVLCARPALDMSLPKEQSSLAEWALTCQQKGVLEEIMDPHLKGMISPMCLKRFSDLAQRCLADHGVDRPTMNEVLWNLEFARRLQENPSETGVTQEAVSSSHGEFAARISSIEEGCKDTVDMDYIFSPEEVFSDLVNERNR